MTNLTLLPSTSVATAVLEALTNIVIVIGADGNVEYVSAAAEDILGYLPSDLLGSGWWQLTHDSVREREHMRQYACALANGALPPRELPYERAIQTVDGKTKWILWSHSKAPGNRIIGIGYDITRRKEAEESLTSRNRELHQQKRDFMCSLRYAREIQRATLPDLQLINEKFTDSFVMHRPRDIVSGDFYWYHSTDTHAFIAVADCTGHGVPGALLTVVGQSLLRDCIVEKKMTDPAEILSRIDRELAKVLLDEQNLSQAKDGMDVGLVVFDLQAREASFCGAFRPLVRISDTGLEVYEGHRFPIGFYLDVPKQFQNVRIPYSTGDMFYLYSDGLTDQFGGKRLRRFNRKQLHKVLQHHSELPAEAQLGAVSRAFDDWKTGHEQMDDVLLMGWRIPA